MTDSSIPRELSSVTVATAASAAERPVVIQPQARVIALASGKSGVGKSSLWVNLGIALARRGKRVCLFDAETDTAHADIMPGLSPKFTPQNLLLQDKSIDELLSVDPDGIKVISAAAGIGEFIHLAAEQQQRLLATLKLLEQRFDYLIINTAASIDTTLIQYLLAAPYTILTITPEPASLSDAFSLLKQLKRYYFSHPLFVIVNKVANLPEAHDTFKQFKQTAAKSLQLEIRYLGYALSDTELAQSSSVQQPILLRQPQAMFSQCLTAISNRLRQLLDQDPTPDHSLSGFFEKLSLPQEQGSSGDRESTAATGSTVDKNALNASLDTPIDEPTPTPISSPTDERAALLAATYYAHLLGSKEAMNG